MTTTPAFLTSNNIFDLVKPLFKKRYGSDSDLEEEEDGGVYLHIASYREELEQFEDSTDLIPGRSAITVEYDYPLSITATKTFDRPAQGFTQRQLISLVCEGYHQIYREEEESSAIIAQPMSEQNPACSLVNRCATNGRYGIWGHDIGDLMLHTLLYNSENDTFSIEVDS